MRREKWNSRVLGKRDKMATTARVAHGVRYSANLELSLTRKNMAFSAGKKTYAVAVLTVVYAVSGYFIGKVETDTAIQLVLGSGLFAALRNAIKN